MRCKRFVIPIRMTSRLCFIFVFVVLVVVLSFTSCGGGNRRPVIEVGIPQPEPAQSVEDTSSPERTALISITPPIHNVSVGGEFEFVLMGEFSESIHQASGRIVYESSYVEPVEVKRGELIPDDAIFVAKLDAGSVIPFAFTVLPGGKDIQPGSGELLRVKFRLVKRPPSGFRIRLMNNPAFLQLRDMRGKRVPFDLKTEVVGR